MATSKLHPDMKRELPDQLTINAKDIRGDVGEQTDLSYSQLELYYRHEGLKWDSAQGGKWFSLGMLDKSPEQILNLSVPSGILTLAKSFLEIEVETFSGDDTSANRVCLEGIHHLFEDIILYEENDFETSRLYYGNRYGLRKTLLDNFCHSLETLENGTDWGVDCYEIMNGTHSTLSSDWNATTKKNTLKFYFNPFYSMFRTTQFKEFDKIFNLGAHDMRMKFMFNTIRKAFTWPNGVVQDDVEVRMKITPKFEIYNFSPEHPLMLQGKTSYEEKVKRIHTEVLTSSILSPLEAKVPGQRIHTIESIVLALVLENVYNDPETHGRYDSQWITNTIDTVSLKIDNKDYHYRGKLKSVDKLENKLELHRLIGNDVSQKNVVDFHNWKHGDDGSKDGKMMLYFDLSLFTNAVSGYATQLINGIPASWTKDVDLVITYKSGQEPVSNVVPIIHFIYSDYVRVDNGAGTLEMRSGNYTL